MSFLTKNRKNIVNSYFEIFSLSIFRAEWIAKVKLMLVFWYMIEAIIYNMCGLLP